MRGCRTPRGPSPGPGWVPSASRGAVRTAPPAPAPSSRRHLSGLPSSCGYGAASPHAGTATSEVEVLGRKQANNSFCSVRREDVSSSRRLCSGPGPSPRCFQKLCRSEPRVASLSPAPGDAPGEAHSLPHLLAYPSHLFWRVLGCRCGTPESGAQSARGDAGPGPRWGTGRPHGSGPRCRALGWCQEGGRNRPLLPSFSRLLLCLILLLPPPQPCSSLSIKHRVPGPVWAAALEAHLLSEGRLGRQVKKVTEAPRGATKEPKQVESAVGGGACFPWGGQRRPPSEGVRSYHDVRTRSLPPSRPHPSPRHTHLPRQPHLSK